MKTLVVGVGNLLKYDDGLGIHVIEKLKKMKLPDNVEIMDLGISGMDILHHSENFDRIIFIDAIKVGKSPGTVYRIKPRDVEVGDDSLRDMIYMSMHEIDLEKVIGLGRKLGQMPDNVVIIGCEPKETNKMKIGLTKEVETAIPDIVQLVLEELNSSL
ncbi:hydrogenase maturation protease [[Eubacterium] cellulosolvens]